MQIKHSRKPYKLISIDIVVVVKMTSPISNTSNPLVPPESLPASIPNLSSTISQESLNRLKHTLEKRGMEAVIDQKLLSKPLFIAQKECLSIMKKGSDVFYEETGRHMTYSEMREIYG